MKIELWEGGLLAHEVDAIEQIEKHFTEKKQKKKPANRGSLKDQLGSMRNDSILPWKGYAGFRFVDKGKEGEFDLVIITHCNVLIIELKHWNRGEITSQGDKWYKNKQEMGRSPVSVTRNKKFLLEKKLNPYKNHFSNKGYRPFVHFFVVMTGNAGFDKLKEDQKEHTISLAEFLKLKTGQIFDNRFRPHPNSKVLNKDFHIFDKLFDRQATDHKHMVINGYQAISEVFQHPRHVYKEYLSVSEASSNDEALLRLWDFNKVKGSKAKTPEGRFDIISREREILSSIKHHDYNLYKYCLTSLTSPQKDEITTQYSELYELPPGHFRFNEFIGKFGTTFDEQNRINLVKLLFAKFADLHQLKIAHRDLGDHSIWISPAKEIALSNFISAYHQPLGTVGDNRESLSVNHGMTPFGMPVNDKTTPFHMDVYTLAVLGWHILNGVRLSPKSLKDLIADINSSEKWFAPIFQKAASTAPYTDATELFDSIKLAEPRVEQNLDFDISTLEPFRHAINLTRQYPEDKFILETNDKEIYLSNGLVVKAWLNVNPTAETPVLGHKIFCFLERLGKLKSLAPPYLPAIHEAGIATRTGSLFIVMDEIKGEKWSDITPSDDWVNLVTKLISAVEHLHSLHITHGDLHPDNVLVNTVTESVWLIDIPDFSADEQECKNHRYSPDNIDGCTALERDNFAVMRMAAEILGLEWGEDSNELSGISDAINTEMNDHEYGFRSLERFRDAMKSPTGKGTFEFIEITVRGEFEDLDIYPDNGKLYLDIETSNKDKAHARIKFHGVGGNVALIYVPFQTEFSIGFKPYPRSTVSRRDIDSAKLELPFGLRIRAGQYSDLSELNSRISDNEELSRAVDLVLNPVIDEPADEQQSTEASQSEPEVKEVKPLAISTHKLWQGVIDTETESHPYVELLGEPEKAQGQNDQLIISHKSEIDPLGGFKKSDVVEALLVQNDKEQTLGEVILKHSSLSEVRLSKLRDRANRLKENDIVFFRSRQDKASYDKRKGALERLLSRESTISSLVDYFEPDGQMDAICYDVEVSNEDFERYDREDEFGNKISLNAQQRAAFQKLVNFGPLSLLQGPPGTGKTEFIAAFVHYLVEKQQVKNILLVSQSHEAVNTAAERIRQHCQRLNTPLDVVRFSNREGAVSDGLMDVYSNAIVTERRELFAAEAAHRSATLSQSLGLQPEYLAALTNVELKLFKKLDEIISLSDSLKSTKISEKDKKGLKKIYSELHAFVAQSLEEEYGIQLKSVELTRIKELVWEKLKTDYGIRPDEAIKARALARISRDMLDVLATDRVNYDEFFARSRQLVTGTCVGIGQRHIGINENQYDWVIIDEAARSIASELAIAMQSGKRILLVGDHKQLPPLYSDPHKKALSRKLGLVTLDNDGDIGDLLQSDFARAFESGYGNQTGAKLLTQYRMANPIGDLVSTCFYDGDLETGSRNIPDIYHSGPKELNSFVTWIDTSGLGKDCHHQEDKGISIYNRAEADEIIRLLKSIADDDHFVSALTSSVKDGEPAIGIICMYAEQKRLIRQKFKEQVWEDGFKSLVKIDTVDSYQGKENRVVILSITRSCPKLSPGFLRSPNRINVALSRAMDRLIIVGAAQMWHGKNKSRPLGKVVEFIEGRQDLDSYCILMAQRKNKKGGKR